MGFSRQEYWSGVPLPSLSRPITSWGVEGEKIEGEKIEGEKVKIVTNFLLLASKITADDCSHEIRR